LLAAFRAGHQALGELLQLHRDYLLKVINEEIDPRLTARQGASDVVQNAFVNILAHVQGESGGLFAVTTNEDLRRWLRRVCLNALKKGHRDEGREQRDFRRDQSATEALDQVAGGPSPSSVLRQRERDEVVGQALNALPEADRMLLRLREWHGLSYEALAELLEGEPSAAGRMRVRRRLAALLLQLGEDLLQNLDE
jgi:RNA polymerase sigma-70 factor (ECF subfamily)